MKTTWIGVGLTAGLVAFACGGDDSTTNGGPDSGGNPDTSSNADSGNNNDSGINNDAGNDSGNNTDAAGFDPGTVPGLVLWLDAAKNVTQTGNRISKWGDQTSHKNDASQAIVADGGTGDRQPSLVAAGINGLPTVHFDRGAAGNGTTGQMLLIPNNTDKSLEWGMGDFYVAVVARFDNDPADGLSRGSGVFFTKITGGSSGTNTGVMLTGNIPSASAASQGLDFITSTTPGDGVSVATKYWDGNARIFTASRVGKVLDLAVNGVSVGTSTSTGNDVSNPSLSVRIGADGDAAFLRLNGDISEELAVKGPINLADRAGIMGYLKAKYGL
jgi:hypothetical protein